MCVWLFCIVSGVELVCVVVGGLRLGVVCVFPEDGGIRDAEECRGLGDVYRRLGFVASG